MRSQSSQLVRGMRKTHQNLRQQALGVLVCVGQQDLLCICWVGDNNKGLGTKGKPKDLSIDEEQLVQGNEHRLANNLADVACCSRHALCCLGTPLPTKLGKLEREETACRYQLPSFIKLFGSQTKLVHKLLSESRGWVCVAVQLGWWSCHFYTFHTNANSLLTKTSGVGRKSLAKGACHFLLC